MSRPKYALTREVTQAECWWLPEPVPAGTTVYRCTKPTYGTVRDFPATFDPDGDYPFFELPSDAVTPDPSGEGGAPGSLPTAVGSEPAMPSPEALDAQHDAEMARYVTAQLEREN